ncbi:MAG: DUF4160 domain-containing protein [Terriglobia bacterium]
MPTVLRVRGYRFFFYSREGKEPPHIHVDQAERYAKFWLNPVRLAMSVDFRSNELTEIRQLVEENQALFKEKWDGHLGHQN